MKPSSHRAFTLLELMIAGAISVVIAAALSTVFLAVHRLVRYSYNEAKVSPDLRRARDKMLFNVLDEGGSALWSGLLSAKETKIEGANQIGFKAIGIDSGSGYPMERGSQHWKAMALSDGSSALDGSKLTTKNIYAVTLEKSSGDLTRRARVVIPAFGKDQDSSSELLFPDSAAGGGQ